MAYDNTNRFTLGKNKTPKQESSPPYTGKINIDGKDYYLNAWVQKNSETGESFFSGTVKAVDQRLAEARQAIDGAPKKPDFDDDIPF